MSVLHICCNLAGSTVFPQLFEALDAQGIEQIVFVPEKRAADLNKTEPHGVKTVRAMTVKQSDALFFFRKAQRSVPVIEKQIDLSGVTLIHAHTLFTDGERFRKDIEKMEFIPAGEEERHPITISGGISTFPCIPDTEEDANTIIRYAEHALYNAKKRGKNKIVQFSHLNLGE